jgi:hypothetical protein
MVSAMMEGTHPPCDAQVLQTRVPSSAELAALQLPSGALDGGAIAWGGPKGGVLVPCGDGSVLEVLRLQPPTKKPQVARDFKNGLGQRQLRVHAPPAAARGGEQQWMADGAAPAAVAAPS